MRTIKILLALIILTLLLTGCSSEKKPDPKVHYINIDCVIVDKMLAIPMNESRNFSHAFLIRSVKDTNMYCEYTSIGCNCQMTDSFFYTHYIGDTLHFDYIAKRRFFKNKLRWK